MLFLCPTKNPWKSALMFLLDYNVHRIYLQTSKHIAHIIFEKQKYFQKKMLNIDIANNVSVPTTLSANTFSPHKHQYKFQIHNKIRTSLECMYYVSSIC